MSKKLTAEEREKLAQKLIAADLDFDLNILGPSKKLRKSLKAPQRNYVLNWDNLEASMTLTSLLLMITQPQVGSNTYSSSYKKTIFR